MSKDLILLSDDDHSIRLVASRALEKAGYEVKTSETISELRALIEDGAASVLITDVAYPDGDALEMLPEIKARRPDLNIIVMSARSTLPTAVRAQEGEVFAYMPKPFALDALVETVGDALQAWRTREGEAGETSVSYQDNLSEAITYHLNRFFEAHRGDFPAQGLHGRIIAEVERPLIEKTLKVTRGNQIKAAEILGLNRNTLRKKIHTLGISVMMARSGKYR